MTKSNNIELVINPDRFNYLLDLYKINYTDFVAMLNEGRKKDLLNGDQLESIVKNKNVSIKLLKRIDKVFKKGLTWYLTQRELPERKSSSIFFRKHNRITGQYTFQFWAMVTCNAIIPQLFWWKKFRSNLTLALIISLLINVGMWYERFNIVVTSLAKDYLPSAWTNYTPSWVEVSLFVGTLGIFAVGVLFFFRFIPMIAISEVKGVLKLGKTTKSH